MTDTAARVTVTHPLSMLSADEVVRASGILRAEGHVDESTLIAHIVLDEPEKATLASWKAGDPVERRVRASLVPGPGCGVQEALVSLSTGQVLSVEEVPAMRSALLVTEALLDVSLGAPEKPK
jgi:primary-amine oxidase